MGRRHNWRNNTGEAPSPVHGWLSRHKIIFETIVGAALVIASILVAYLQWKTAEKQTELASIQTAVLRRQSEPNFVLSTHLRKRDDETIYSDDELTIENFGGAAREIHTRCSTWVFISVLRGAERRELKIPLNGYYTATFHNSGVVTGVVSRSIGDRNNQKFIELERSTRGLAQAKGWYVEMNLQRYANVSYRDILGTIHDEYYLVRPISGAIPVSNQDGRTFVDDWMKSLDVQDLDRIDAKIVWSVIESHLGN